MTSTHPDGGTRLSRGGAVVYRGLGVAAFAETVVTQESGAVKIPDDVPLDVACVLGCAVQTGVGAVLNTARVEEGDTVLVMGLGGVGLSIVQGARIAAATTILVSDPVAERRELARQFGATDVIDPREDDVVGVAQQLTGGVGVDFAFDAVGSNALIEAGINATRFGGTTVVVGVPAIDEPLSYSSGALFAAAAKTVRGSLLGSSNSLREIPRLISLWQRGHLDLEALITERRPLADINLAVEDLEASRGVRTVIEL
jgi:Zn-dependent alcohol dehydrogenase